ncbi:MAG: hypothetical protein DMG37_15390 [Acidobacteria bacterium]|nr:MAG: hypothetical protein DMG37_15390 [Acidobacteriota bacterium]
MSEAAPVSAVAQPRHLTTARVRRHRLNPLEALERGFALFQSTFAREAWRYYAGAAPLVLCFIPMWVVNGQIRLSDGALLMEAALLAAACLLRMRMVAGYVQGVRERAFGVPRPKLEGPFARAAAIGRMLAWKTTLSAATLTMLPTVAVAPWFYTAWQFADLEAGEDVSERHSIRGCLVLAGQWYGASLLLFLMLFPLWTAVWLNGLVLAMILPQLLHSIFGVNTLLSTVMGTYALLRSSAFWLSLFAGAWLALDPIVKCTFVVVYQHLRSLREGDDLRGLLASLPREQQKKADMLASARVRRTAMTGAFVILATILLVGSQVPGAHAAQVSASTGSEETAADSARRARVQKLRQALDEESQRALYRWHDAEHQSPPTWFEKLLSNTQNAISRAWNVLWNFLRKLWPRGLSPSMRNEKRGGWQLKDLRLWLALVAVMTLALGALLFWLRRRREAAQLSLPVVMAPLPDLSNAAVASQRSEDEWFALAERLEGEGELRLALRAAYLALLAGLAQREWLTIRRDRTNREYLDEFTRRWRRRPQAAVEARAEVPENLRSSLRLFERVWYGFHVVTPAAVTAYRQGQRELLNHV